MKLTRAEESALISLTVLTALAKATGQQHEAHVVLLGLIDRYEAEIKRLEDEVERLKAPPREMYS